MKGARQAAGSTAPPAIGSTITFRYQELSDAGVPRFPSYLRVAHSARGGAVRAANAAKPTAASSAPAAL